DAVRWLSQSLRKCGARVRGAATNVLTLATDLLMYVHWQVGSRGCVMAKTETIIVRVTPGLKRRITAAADRQGKSVTTFVLEAAERAAEKVESLPTALEKPRGRGACPTWFKARCWEAGQGGAGGYRAAAYALAGALPSLQPWELPDQEWAAAL